MILWALCRILAVALAVACPVVIVTGAAAPQNFVNELSSLVDIRR